MIRWFTQNGVAANLLAIVTIIAGFFVATTIKLELFPSLDLDTVQVNVAYPGAAPEEVESGIIEIIEDRIADIDGIKKITANANEGLGTVLAEIQRGYNATEVADRIKVRIDTIDNFPEEAESPTVEELLIRNEVISLAIFGDTDPQTLKKIAERIRDELNIRENITQVDIKGIAEFELSINVSEISLRQFDLTFDDVVEAIRRSSVDIPGGSIKSSGGDISLRTIGRAYDKEAFSKIPVRNSSEGAVTRIGDIATVTDGFVDDPLTTKFNGERAVVLNIFAVGDQSALDVADRVKTFAKEIQNEIPEGIQIKAFRDFTFYLKGRLQMLINNGIFGLLLVLLILTLFLRPSLAFFVMLGIPISFLGSMLFLQLLGISINLASLFGFILVLGIVVDDAIVVGESVFTQFQKHGGPGVNASVVGTKKVSVPVTFAVLTTIVAFLPVLTIPGFLGKFFFPIPVVVIACLIWSLIESKLILPYHLTLCNIGNHNRDSLGWFSRGQRAIADSLERFIQGFYRPILLVAVKWRYTTVSIFIGIFTLTAALLAGKHIPFVFFPPVPSDYIIAKLVMPEGTPLGLTQKAIEQMERGLESLIEETEKNGLGNPFDNSVITIGAQPFEGSGGPIGSTSDASRTNVGEIAVELVKREDLPGGSHIEALSAPNLANQWRTHIQPIAGVQELSFSANAAGGGGLPIDIQLSGRDFKQLKIAAQAVKAKLNTYEGLFDIRDSYSSGKREIQLDILPSAEPLGLRQADLGGQVRAAFYGVEAQRIQRGRDDIKVMVRYPLEERRSIENLSELRIRTAAGETVPFGAVADFQVSEGFSNIKRIDRRRVINVFADADKSVADLGLIRKSLKGTAETHDSLDTLLADYPGVNWTFEGEAREQADIFASLTKTTLVAFFVIYALLAVPLKSYIQPLIIMIVIPFGLIGAIGGHAIMNQPMSILSILGFVALAGVVVNDSLVLVDFINQERASGVPLRTAIIEAGALRFRPILLTSLTTFAGLLPLLFEKSLQAQFLIPMAISLSFGVLFATLITLILVPSIYTIIEDVRALLTPHRAAQNTTNPSV